MDKIRNACARYKAFHLRGKQERNIFVETDRVDTSFIPYDFELFHRHVVAERDKDEMWEGYFESLGVTPLRIFYEEMVEDMHAVLDQITTYLGVPCLPVDPDIKIPLDLYDDKAEELIEFYRFDCYRKGILL